MLRAHGASHPGRVRRINEDAWLSAPALGLFVVADGMGGHNAGEVASRLTVDTIHAFALRTQEPGDVTWPFGYDGSGSYDANRLRTAVKLANQRVVAASQSRDDYTGMGTTVVAALVRGTTLTFASAGDSRLYSFIDGTLTQLTRDDSWVAVVASQAGLDEAAIARHPMRHVLTNAIGASSDTEPKIGEHALRERERLLLCSDGLHGMASDEAIAEILRAQPDLAAAVDQLIARALDGGGRDNITAVLVEFGP